MPPPSAAGALPSTGSGSAANAAGFEQGTKGVNGGAVRLVGTYVA